MFLRLKRNARIWRMHAGAAGYALMVTAGLGAQPAQTFRGVIADSVCATSAGHTPMLHRGQTMADCTISCVKKGAKYTLFSSEDGMVYQLDDQTMPKAFAARLVLVIGNLDKGTKTIHVADVIPGLPPNVKQAKSVYLECGTCAGGLAAAKQDALLEIQHWKRFNVVPNRQKAGLIFLFSTNRYRGDYDGGKNSEPVVATYMSVIDPVTGHSVWSDSKRSGYMLLGSATKALIDEFRVDLEAEEGHINPALQRDENQKVLIPQPGK
jgi:hypothetical protein